MKIIILNGPIGCGKDTIGNLLMKSGAVNVITTSFKFDLIKDTATYYDMPLDVLQEACEDRALKEVPMAALDGKSPREALQFVSEEVTKPVKGDDYYGKQALARINETVRLADEGYMLWDAIVFTDGGFIAEAMVLAEQYEVVIAQLHGRGTWEGDTRDYIELDTTHSHTVKLQLLDYKPELAVAQLEKIILP